MALDTFRPYLVGKGFFFYPAKSAFLEKLRHVGKHKHLSDTQFARLTYAGIGEFLADALVLERFHNCQRLNLRKVFPEDMQGGTPNKLIILDEHKKVPDIFIQLTQGTRQHYVFCRKVIDELIYLFYVVYRC